MNDKHLAELREKLLDYFSDGAPSYVTANAAVKAHAQSKVEDIMALFATALAQQDRESRDLIRDQVARLNWIAILDEAIRMRPSSWPKHLLIEYRNASDEIEGALMRACYLFSQLGC